MKDSPAIAELYEAAKSLLKNQGIGQWQDGYPNEQSAISDITNGTSYIIVDGTTVIGTACISIGTEPTYSVIIGGGWRGNNSRYAFLHRVAVSPDYKGRGLSSLFFQEMERLAKEEQVQSLRGDTHKENLAMQKTMENNGLERRGIIYLENGDERVAYEKVLD